MMNKKYSKILIFTKANQMTGTIESISPSMYILIVFLFITISKLKRKKFVKKIFDEGTNNHFFFFEFISGKRARIQNGSDI